MAGKILYVCQEIFPYLPESEQSALCRQLVQAMQERGNEIRTFITVASTNGGTSFTR